LAWHGGSCFFQVVGGAASPFCSLLCTVYEHCSYKLLRRAVVLRWVCIGFEFRLVSAVGAPRFRLVSVVGVKGSEILVSVVLDLCCGERQCHCLVFNWQARSCSSLWEMILR